MKAEWQSTTDHRTIRSWAEQRGGKPVRKKLAGPAELPIEFAFNPNGTPDIEDISWEEFFREFDANSLCFRYQETNADGALSHFAEFVKEDRAGRQEIEGATNRQAALLSK